MESKWFLERSIIDNLGRGEVVTARWGVVNFFISNRLFLLPPGCLSVRLTVKVSLSRSGVETFSWNPLSLLSAGVWLQAEGINNQAAFAFAPVTRCPGGSEESGQEWVGQGGEDQLELGDRNVSRQRSEHHHPSHRGGRRSACAQRRRGGGFVWSGHHLAAQLRHLADSRLNDQRTCARRHLSAAR